MHEIIIWEVKRREYLNHLENESEALNFSVLNDSKEKPSPLLALSDMVLRGES